MTNLRLIAEAEAFLYNQGTYYHAYNKLGAHIMEVDGQTGVVLSFGRPMPAMSGWWGILTAGRARAMNLPSCLAVSGRFLPRRPNRAICINTGF